MISYGQDWWIVELLRIRWKTWVMSLHSHARLGIRLEDGVADESERDDIFGVG